MDIGVIGGGINGLCCAWQLAERGHQVTVYERDAIMRATSQASSKLLHGGLRYLENGELRLVREALRERDAWLTRVPELAWPIRLIMPIYRDSRCPRWMVSLGLGLYDRIAGGSLLPKSTWLTTAQISARVPELDTNDLRGGFEFSDGQMDDYALGAWVAARARECGVTILEHSGVMAVTTNGDLQLAGKTVHHDHLVNVAGPWAASLLERSGLRSPYRLDLVRGSHIVIDHPTRVACLLEVPGERRIFFVLPWQGKTLVGTTEERQNLEQSVHCSDSEQEYLLQAFSHYFPTVAAVPIATFAGLRPLLQSAKDPTKASREYAIHRDGKLTSVFGGKWTTDLALANRIAQTIN